MVATAIWLFHGIKFCIKWFLYNCFGHQVDFGRKYIFWSKRPDGDQKTKWKNWRPEAFPKDQNGQIWSRKRPVGNTAQGFNFSRGNTTEGNRVTRCSEEKVAKFWSKIAKFVATVIQLFSNPKIYTSKQYLKGQNIYIKDHPKLKNIYFKGLNITLFIWKINKGLLRR